MANTKEIQRRIKSVSNTKKITRAMEMVAAAKMRRATEAVLATRAYADLGWATIVNIANSVNAGKYLHPLFSERAEIRKEAIILISSNRGLCGGFNSTVIQKAVDSARKHGVDKIGQTKSLKGEMRKEVDFIVIGRKGLAVKNRYGGNIVAAFDKSDACYEVKEVAPLAKMVIADFLSEKYDKIMLAYTDFISPSKQAPRVKQLLPVDLSAYDEYLGVVGQDENRKEEKKSYIFTYEPGPEEVLNEMLPRLIEIQLFQVLLESNASEHSARMSAMRQASDAADDLVKELKLYYNKVRQSDITSEISEIVAGVNALSD